MNTTDLMNFEWPELIFLEFIKPVHAFNFKDKFKEFAPEISNEIEGASLDPLCTCVNRIKSYVKNEKPLECLSFLASFVNENNLQEFLDLTVNIIYTEKNNNAPRISYGGRIAKTTISEWKNFHAQIEAENGHFKNFSVIRDGDDILVFFL